MEIIFKCNKAKFDRVSSYLSEIKVSTDYYGRHYYDPVATHCDERIIGNYELMFVNDGRLFITIDNINYTVNKNNLILIPPFTCHKINSIIPSDVYWVHFEILPFTESYSIWEHTPFRNNNYVFEVENSGEIVSIMNIAFNNFYQETLGNYAICNTSLIQILAILMQESGKSTGGECYDFNTYKNITDRCIDFFCENLDKNYTVSDIAEIMHFSPSYLYKCFANAASIPPSKLFKYIKMKNAETLLLTTGDSIGLIAEKLGFKNQYHFSRVFKEHFNMPPTELRKI